MRDSTFTSNHSDDTLHAVLGSVTLVGNRFLNNFADAVDFDFIRDASISRNYFSNAVFGMGGDGIDVSFVRNVEISDNTIMHFDDKCISIGENARVSTIGNKLSDCNIGVAVKDNSHAELAGDTITSQREAGVSLYRKKQEFINGGIARITNIQFNDNKEDIQKDAFSSLSL